MKLGQMDNRIIKIILVSVGVAAFFAVISTTYSIFQSNSPDVLNNCVQKPVLVSSEGTLILSRDDAAAFLESRINGSFTFIQNTVEVCNPPNMGYMYITPDNVNYVLCEDGEFYAYENVCTEGGQAESLFSMLFKSKNDASEKK
ncbi:MAG: hypothetical protein ABIF85_06590 [Nanoarchaeota archaeon]|nr:hypothetical protein [Nanoarchaeota archaeon]MBU4300563.1 hypothetical protein [Nanoarchaeota archaeon]MBU4451317.1 hypothetical protein [Nanoarchaeota archaeon]MCG2723278.1 hypothetical protein [archaeon]